MLMYTLVPNFSRLRPPAVLRFSRIHWPNEYSGRLVPWYQGGPRGWSLGSSHPHIFRLLKHKTIKQLRVRNYGGNQTWMEQYSKAQRICCHRIWSPLELTFLVDFSKRCMSDDHNFYDSFISMYCFRFGGHFLARIAQASCSSWLIVINNPAFCRVFHFQVSVLQIMTGRNEFAAVKSKSCP